MYTLEQLNALDEAIASGTLTVEYADKKVTYRSQREMLDLRRLIMTELGLISGNSGRKFAEFDKGVY